METYTWLRTFADSWHLLFMVLFFIGVILWAFRPGSRKVHDETSEMIFRNEDSPADANDIRQPRDDRRDGTPDKARDDARAGRSADKAGRKANANGKAR